MNQLCHTLLIQRVLNHRKKHFFGKHLSDFTYMCDECHIHIGHQNVSDTAALLLLEAFVPHRYQGRTIFVSFYFFLWNCFCNVYCLCRISFSWLVSMWTSWKHCHQKSSNVLRFLKFCRFDDPPAISCFLMFTCVLHSCNSFSLIQS